MKDVLQYKDFIGSVHFSSDDSIFFGKIEGINDLVTFEGSSVKELIKSFHEAVNDYIEICKLTEKPIHKSFKGSFNVRIPAELHKKAVQKSILSGQSLNQFVKEAIENKLLR